MQGRRRALALAAALLLAGCASDGEEPAAPEPAPVSTETVVTTGPLPPPPTVEPVTSTTTPAPGPTTRTEPRVTTGTGPMRREAPPTNTGALVFDRILVVAGEDGAFLGRANVRNAGAAYLNDLAVRWRILGREGDELDRGVARWPSLAPGETRTIELDGSRRYSEAWARVTFSPR